MHAMNGIAKGGPRRGAARAPAALALCAAALAASPAAFAYVGPGAGLGVLGVAVAVLAAVVMGLVGLVVWPIRKIAQLRKVHAQANAAPSHEPLATRRGADAATAPRAHGDAAKAAKPARR